MNKQTTFIVIGAVALLGGLFVLGQPSGVTEAPAPAAEEVGASALAAV
ncbi:MAG: hypothetical protein HYW56_01030, partial [Candidatus Harrisonbacteria bacterium]|nr:hypothetical protein [Candidatus Harrisonbacteria bacterium]